VIAYVDVQNEIRPFDEVSSEDPTTTKLGEQLSGGGFRRKAAQSLDVDKCTPIGRLLPGGSSVCHSGRSEESLLCSHVLVVIGIPRCARTNSSQKPHAVTMKTCPQQPRPGTPLQASASSPPCSALSDSYMAIAARHARGHYSSPIATSPGQFHFATRSTRRGRLKNIAAVRRMSLRTIRAAACAAIWNKV
jgi:hypothetical protein